MRTRTDNGTSQTEFPSNQPNYHWPKDNQPNRQPITSQIATQQKALPNLNSQLANHPLTKKQSKQPKTATKNQPHIGHYISLLTGW